MFSHQSLKDEGRQEEAEEGTYGRTLVCVCGGGGEEVGEKGGRGEEGCEREWKKNKWKVRRGRGGGKELEARGVG